MKRDVVFKNHATLSRGFTLVELIIIMIIVGILAAIVVPKFIDLRGEAAQKATDSVAAALNAASAANYQLSRAGSDKAIPIQNCQDIAEVLSTSQALPEDYEIGNLAIAAGSWEPCIVTHPDDSTTATFIGHAVP